MVFFGMKWGHRKKYYNTDGTLNDIGKKKASKKLQKYSNKLNKKLSKNHSIRYINAYNKAASDMNNGGIEKYNKKWHEKIEKKYGKEKAKNYNYGEDSKYIEEYSKLFNKTLEKHYNNMTLSEAKKNKYYKKGLNLVKKYEMEKWDNLAKDLIKKDKQK